MPEKICPTCQKIYNDDTLYCGKCGSKLTEHNPDTEKQVVYNENSNSGNKKLKQIKSDRINVMKGTDQKIPVSSHSRSSVNPDKQSTQ